MTFLIRLVNKTIYPVYSFFINCVYWIVHIKDLKHAIDRKQHIKEIVELPGNESTIKILIEVFDWTKDKYIDWMPWIITLLDKEFKDDCDGAATYGRWLYKCIGVESDLVVLTSIANKKAHMVCVHRDRTQMISNNEMVELDPDNWKKSILEHFSNKYKHVIVI